MAITGADYALVAALRRNLDSVIFGKTDTTRMIVTALLARGHVLLEDVPGVGKTAMARALARSIDCRFRRIQFTPDLLPSDITGMSILDAQRHEFVFKPGPVFGHVLLADEINRATPRTQSALLEAMNESSVSVDGVTHPLPSPFMVIATQNPLEFTGTYPLPESQLDRFLMVLRIGYPSPDEERRIVSARQNGDPVEKLKPALTGAQVEHLIACAQEVRVDDAITSYLVDIATRTREEKSLLAGVSTRGAIHLSHAVRAYALVEGRSYAVPDDVKAVAVSVLAHRIIEKRTRASADGRDSVHQILRRILADVPVPQ